MSWSKDYDVGYRLKICDVNSRIIEVWRKNDIDKTDIRLGTNIKSFRWEGNFVRVEMEDGTVRLYKDYIDYTLE